MSLLQNKYLYIIVNILALLFIIYFSLYLIWKLNYQNISILNKMNNNIVEGFNEPQVIYKNLWNKDLNNVSNNTTISIDDNDTYSSIQNTQHLYYNLNSLNDFIGKDLSIKALIQLETIQSNITECSLLKIFSNFKNDDTNTLNSNYFDISNIKENNRYLELYLERDEDAPTNYLLKLRNNNTTTPYNLDLSVNGYRCKENDIIELYIQINVSNLENSDPSANIYEVRVHNIFIDNSNTNKLYPTQINDYSAADAKPNLFIDTKTPRDISNSTLLERSIAQFGFDIVSKRTDGTDIPVEAVKVNLIKLDVITI